MSETDDEKRKKAFADYLKEMQEWQSTPEYQEMVKRAKKNADERRVAFDLLEEEFADQGLKIYSWGGACPTQGFGRLGDDYWYFRFRSNHGTLSVGPYDEDIEERIYQRDLEREREREAADPGNPWNMTGRARKALPTDKDYYPHRITRRASKSGRNPADTYNGDMTDADEAYEFLKALLLDLQDVPEEDQVADWLLPGYVPPVLPKKTKE